MKFIHTADIHLGANPDVGKSLSQNDRNSQSVNRAKEIWNSFERLLEICEKEKADLLLICGDMFHRQPLLRELKEVNYLFSKLTATQVVIISGNHDYVKKDSYYRTFQWAENVHMLLDRVIDHVEFPKISTAVYGHSYHTREITEKTYEGNYAEHRQKYEILMIHGGDEKHIPVKKEEVLELGYDYVAMGHIHKPHVLIPGKMVYAGTLEPSDKTDVGVHGYTRGEITDSGCSAEFVPFAKREYVQLEVESTEKMSGYELKEKLRQMITERGSQHFYKVSLTGFRDPEIQFDLTDFYSCGNVAEIVDYTRALYDFEKIQQQNGDNILGALIEEWKACDKDSVEYLALCESIRALMETRKA